MKLIDTIHILTNMRVIICFKLTLPDVNCLMCFIYLVPLDPGTGTVTLTLFDMRATRSTSGIQLPTYLVPCYFAKLSILYIENKKCCHIILF